MRTSRWLHSLARPRGLAPVLALTLSLVLAGSLTTPPVQAAPPEAGSGMDMEKAKGDAEQGPGAAQPKPRSVRRDTIGADELAKQLEGDAPPHILDVRSAEEFAEGHIPGATNVPVDELEERVGALGWAPEDEIVLHCERGGRAGQAYPQLRRAGYQNVRLLRGHMKHWRSRDLPTVSEESAPEAGTE